MIYIYIYTCSLPYPPTASMENNTTRSRTKKGWFLFARFYPDKSPGSPASEASTGPRSDLGQTNFRLL